MIDFPDWLKTAGKVAGSAAKYYIDYKDQKRKNEVTEQAYRQYAADVANAKAEAQAAIDVNLTPMEVLNTPTTKAGVSDFTAVAARGGLMNLPTRQRKRYAIGTDEEDIEIMEPESVGDFELKQEEGVPIGPMAGFPDTGDPLSNAQQVWQSGAIDQGIYQMDFNLFFQSGDWMDYISKEEVQGDMQMAKGNFNNPPYQPTEGAQDAAIQEIMAAKGGIIGLRHGGRPGYDLGIGPVGRRMSPQQFMTDEEASLGNPGNAEMYEEEIMATPDGELEMIDVMDSIIIMTADGMVSISREDYDKVMSGEITQEEALANAGHESGIRKIELGNAKGGLPKRVRKAPGGIMNLGGMEKDYRTTGGFVPIGAYERKDDVPARLSKNEFVMTADAVRAAGGGSINKGAQRMYNTMKHLEASPTAKRMTA